jgi:hypothetical protein
MWRLPFFLKFHSFIEGFVAKNSSSLCVVSSSVGRMSSADRRYPFAFAFANGSERHSLKAVIYYLKVESSLYPPNISLSSGVYGL